MACATLPTTDFEPFDANLLPTAADHPDAPAVIVVDRGEVSFPKDEAGVRLARLSRRLRIRKLRDLPGPTDALTLPVDPGSGLYGLRARISDLEAGRQFDYSERDFELRKLEEGRTARVLPLPDLAPGDVVEVVYDQYFDDPRLLPPWRFQNSVPTVRSEYSVVLTDDVPADFRFSEDGRFVVRPPERFETPEGVRFSWIHTGMPALWDEASAPRAGYRAPSVWILYGPPETRTWDGVAAWLKERVDLQAPPPDPWRIRVQDLTAEGDPADKALRVAELVVAEFKAAEPQVPLWRAAWLKPARAAEAPTQSAASLNLWLVRLLRAAGLKAHPALYSDRSHLSLAPDAPTLYGVDGLVAAVELEGGWMFLDGAEGALTPGVPPPGLQGNRVVVLEPEGTRFVQVPVASPEQSRMELRYEVSADALGRIRGTVEGTATGAEAGRIRALLRRTDPSGWVEAVMPQLRARGAPIPIDGLEVRNLTAFTEPLRFRGIVTDQPLWTPDAFEVFFPSGALIGANLEPPAQVRRSDLILPCPHVADVRVRLRTGDAWSVGLLPESGTLGGSGVEADYRFEQDDRGRLVLHRVWRSSELRIPAEAWPRHLEFLRQVRALEDATVSVMPTGS